MRTKEKEREYNKRSYQKNKDKRKAYALKYYEENKDAVLATVKEYRDNNRDLIQTKGREFYRRKLTNRMLNAARQRAKKRGLDFNIYEEDIFIPEVCPLLLIPLFVTTGRSSVKDNSPSLDRIDPSKGYVKGNVWVISYRANTMKSNSTWQELMMLATHLRYHTDSGRLIEEQPDKPVGQEEHDGNDN